jgi:hypothetical protein
MGRTSRNEEIDRDNVACAIENLWVIPERASRDRTRAHGNHDFRLGHGRVSLLKREVHVASDRPGDQKSIGMPRRRYELDAEARQVEDNRIKNVDVSFASVASAGAYLSKFQRAPQDAVEIAGETMRKRQRLAFI